MITKKINVLQLIRPAEGGMKAHLLYLLRYANHGKFKMIVVCPPGFICKELLEVGVEVFTVPMKGEFCPLEDFAVLKLISRLLVGKKVKILHAHGLKAGLIGRLAAIASKTPIIYYTVHNSLFHGNLSCLQKWACIQMERWLAKFTNKIITVSDALRDDLIKYGKIGCDKLITIYNGIDFERFDNRFNNEDLAKESILLKKEFGFNSKKPLGGTIARLVREKGIIYLLKAAASLNSDINLIIVGDGPQSKELKEAAFKLGLEKSVVFTGRRENILPILHAMDLFVLPSIIEGMGMVILEAMAAAKPVVASKVGGIPEVISHGETGLLVKPKDHTLLAAAIKELLNNSEKARLLGKRGKEMVAKKFSARAMAAKIYNLYQEGASTCED